jgi:hypothetical protein
MRSKITLYSGVLLILMAHFFMSCSHDPVNIEGMDSVCFDTQVFPILKSSCGKPGCHDGRSEEGFDASNHGTILQSVTPGDPRGSSLYKVITSINGEHMMPPDRPLTQLQRSIIEVWIAQGAKNIVCKFDTTQGGGTNGSDSVCFVQKILPLIISNCAMASCHDGTAQGEEDLYPLISYATIRQHVTAFNPTSSSVYRAVNGQGEEFMPPPPKSPLTAVQKELLRKWIAEGAINSDCPNADCDTSSPVGFIAQVKPLIDNYCVSCHNSTVTNGGVNLNGYAQIKLYAESLRNGTPLLIGTIRQISGFKAMPPSIKLDVCSIRKVEIWISEGRLNN